jgi:hypothetical protein
MSTQSVDDKTMDNLMNFVESEKSYIPRINLKVRLLAVSREKMRVEAKKQFQAVRPYRMLAPDFETFVTDISEYISEQINSSFLLPNDIIRIVNKITTTKTLTTGIIADADNLLETSCEERKTAVNAFTTPILTYFLNKRYDNRLLMNEVIKKHALNPDSEKQEALRSAISILIKYGADIHECDGPEVDLIGEDVIPRTNLNKELIVTYQTEYATSNSHNHGDSPFMCYLRNMMAHTSEFTETHLDLFEFFVNNCADLNYINWITGEYPLSIVNDNDVLKKKICDNRDTVITSFEIRTNPDFILDIPMDFLTYKEEIVTQNMNEITEEEKSYLNELARLYTIISNMLYSKMQNKLSLILYKTVDDAMKQDDPLTKKKITSLQAEEEEQKLVDKIRLSLTSIFDFGFLKADITKYTTLFPSIDANDKENVLNGDEDSDDIATQFLKIQERIDEEFSEKKSLVGENNSASFFGNFTFDSTFSIFQKMFESEKETKSPEFIAPLDLPEVVENVAEQQSKVVEDIRLTVLKESFFAFFGFQNQNSVEEITKNVGFGGSRRLKKKKLRKTKKIDGGEIPTRNRLSSSSTQVETVEASDSIEKIKQKIYEQSQQPGYTIKMPIPAKQSPAKKSLDDILKEQHKTLQRTEVENLFLDIMSHRNVGRFFLKRMLELSGDVEWHELCHLHIMSLPPEFKTKDKIFKVLVELIYHKNLALDAIVREVNDIHVEQFEHRGGGGESPAYLNYLFSKIDEIKNITDKSTFISDVTKEWNGFDENMKKRYESIAAENDQKMNGFKLYFETENNRNDTLPPEKKKKNFDEKQAAITWKLLSEPQRNEYVIKANGKIKDKKIEKEKENFISALSENIEITSNAAITISDMANNLFSKWTTNTTMATELIDSISETFSQNSIYDFCCRYRSIDDGTRNANEPYKFRTFFDQNIQNGIQEEYRSSCKDYQEYSIIGNLRSSELISKLINAPDGKQPTIRLVYFGDVISRDEVVNQNPILIAVAEDVFLPIISHDLHSQVIAKWIYGTPIFENIKIKFGYKQENIDLLFDELFMMNIIFENSYDEILKSIQNNQRDVEALNKVEKLHEGKKKGFFSRIFGSNESQDEAIQTISSESNDVSMNDDEILQLKNKIRQHQEYGICKVKFNTIIAKEYTLDEIFTNPLNTEYIHEWFTEEVMLYKNGFANQHNVNQQKITIFSVEKYKYLKEQVLIGHDKRLNELVITETIKDLAIQNYYWYLYIKYPTLSRIRFGAVFCYASFITYWVPIFCTSSLIWVFSSVGSLLNGAVSIVKQIPIISYFFASDITKTITDIFDLNPEINILLGGMCGIQSILSGISKDYTFDRQGIDKCKESVNDFFFNRDVRAEESFPLTRQSDSLFVQSITNSQFQTKLLANDGEASSYIFDMWEKKVKDGLVEYKVEWLMSSPNTELFNNKDNLWKALIAHEEKALLSYQSDELVDDIMKENVKSFLELLKSTKFSVEKSTESRNLFIKAFYDLHQFYNKANWWASAIKYGSIVGVGLALVGCYFGGCALLLTGFSSLSPLFASTLTWAGGTIGVAATSGVVSYVVPQLVFAVSTSICSLFGAWNMIIACVFIWLYSYITGMLQIQARYASKIDRHYSKKMVQVKLVEAVKTFGLWAINHIFAKGEHKIKDRMLWWSLTFKYSWAAIRHTIDRSVNKIIDVSIEYTTSQNLYKQLKSKSKSNPNPNPNKRMPISRDSGVFSGRLLRSGNKLNKGGTRIIKKRRITKRRNKTQKKRTRKVK